jgi:transcriptional regulator with XRE-family HTH domain
MISADFGVRVRAAREAAGLSQAEVARQLGINRVYYSLFEAGRYVPDAAETASLAALASTLRIATDSADCVVVEDGDDVDSTHDEVAPNEVDRSGVARERSTSTVALEELRNAALRGLNSKRVARAVMAAETVLVDLDYPELLAECARAGISTVGLVSVAEFASLPVHEVESWESRASALLICDAIYGTRWRDLGFDDLKTLEDALALALPADNPLRYRRRPALEIIFGDAEDFCPMRKADLAPFIVALARTRAAPAVVASRATCQT